MKSRVCLVFLLALAASCSDKAAGTDPANNGASNSNNGANNGANNGNNGNNGANNGNNGANNGNNGANNGNNGANNGNNDAPLGPYQTEEVTFGADALPGTFAFPENAAGRPTVLLLHQLSQTRAEWTTHQVLPALHAENVVTFAVDLRGHGSPPAGGKGFREFGPSDWAKLPPDTADALAWLRTRPEVDPEHITIVGGSIGANTALLAFAGDPRVKAGAFLSPGLPDYRGVDITMAMRSAGERHVYIVGSRGDSNRAQDAETLAGQATNAESIVLDGSNHGASQLAADAPTRERVVRLLVTGVR